MLWDVNIIMLLYRKLTFLSVFNVECDVCDSPDTAKKVTIYICLTHYVEAAIQIYVFIASTLIGTLFKVCCRCMCGFLLVLECTYIHTYTPIKSTDNKRFTRPKRITCQSLEMPQIWAFHSHAKFVLLDSSWLHGN